MNEETERTREKHFGDLWDARAFGIAIVLAIVMVTGAIGWQHVSGQRAAAEAATKDLPAGYLRASESFVREFEDVKKSYEHLQTRVPAGYVYDAALAAFKPAAPAAPAPAATPSPAAPAKPEK